MNQNGRPRVEPPDTSKFDNNRCDFPGEQLIPYQGKYIAWSPDGTRILASGATEEEMGGTWSRWASTPARWSASSFTRSRATDEPALPVHASPSPAAGCLQFFDALFLGGREEFELTVNGLCPGT